MPNKTSPPATFGLRRVGALVALTSLIVVAVMSPGCSRSSKPDETASERPPAPQPSLQHSTPATPPPPPVAIEPVKRPLPPEITSFAARKEQQAKALAQSLGVEISPNVWDYFAAAKRGDASQVADLWEILRSRSGQFEGTRADPTVRTPVWSTLLEVELAAEAFGDYESKYLFAFGRDIIQTIPPGSIYFGGTDPGRGLVTALSSAHEKGEPFFTITQNGLADGTYLKYLQMMYGEQISIPTSEDSEQAFQDYLADAQQRLKHDKDFPNEPRQIKPGEDIRMVDNRVQVSGQVAVMSINGLLARMIFDHNTNREFFVEESFPLDWMYPYLEPHGLILQLHRESVESISDQSIQQNNAYWDERLRVMIGDWLRPETPVKQVTAFAETVFVNRDFTGFRGDTNFVSNDYASKAFSKLRSAQGGIYAWRAQQTKDAGEVDRMRRAADLAFRQAFALCPYSPEAVFRYTNLLIQAGRIDDALLIAQTAQQFGVQGSSIGNLIRQLERLQQKRTPGDPTAASPASRCDGGAR